MNDEYVGESIEEAAEKLEARNPENTAEDQVSEKLKDNKITDANGDVPYNTLNWVASGRTFEHETEEDADPSETGGEDSGDEEKAGEPDGDAAKLQDYMRFFEGGRLATSSNYMDYLMPVDHATASDAVEPYYTITSGSLANGQSITAITLSGARTEVGTQAITITKSIYCFE